VGGLGFQQMGLPRSPHSQRFRVCEATVHRLPRYVVQRRLFPAFLEMYMPIVKGLRFGHPLAVENDNDELPDLEFGPVIHKTKADQLRAQFNEAINTEEFLSTVAISTTVDLYRVKTLQRMLHLPQFLNHLGRGRCTTRNHSVQSTLLFWWIPRLNSLPR